MNCPLKLFYAAGPGDVIGTYKHWILGKDDPSQVAITYSGQFYDVCRELNAQACVISSNPRKDFYQDEQFTIENLPNSLSRASGIMYHLGVILYGLTIIFKAILFQTDVAVISDSTTYWFIVSILNWFGIAVVPSIHCVIMSEYTPLSNTQK